MGNEEKYVVYLRDVQAVTCDSEGNLRESAYSAKANASVSFQAIENGIFVSLSHTLSLILSLMNVLFFWSFFLLRLH